MMPTFVSSAIVSVPERLLLRGGSWRELRVGVRYGVLEHPRFGPVLIDTGYGPRATSATGRSAMLKLYGAVLRPHLVAAGQPLAVLDRQGHGAGDVQRIVVTHFHADHVAALRDFPSAAFITSGHAWETFKDMGRFARLRHGVFTELLPPDFGSRLLPIEDCAERPLPFGLGNGRDIWGDGSCLAVDLPGHALGHFGLVWPNLDPPLFYAVDTTWLSAALDGRLPRGIASLIYANGAAMRRSADLVRTFRQAGGTVILCHDRVTA